MDSIDVGLHIWFANWPSAAEAADAPGLPSATLSRAETMTRTVDDDVSWKTVDINLNPPQLLCMSLCQLFGVAKALWSETGHPKGWAWQIVVSRRKQRRVRGGVTMGHSRPPPRETERRLGRP